MRGVLAISALLVWSCDSGLAPIGEVAQALSDEVELERVTAVRDVCAGEGLGNGALLAGIAKSETGLAHCWSEATWACQGPASPSCDGGPVIAGAGDGPCQEQQGGLGMFQFDAGTYAQTLARDGEDILLLEGNIAKAIEFVVDRLMQEVEVATSRNATLSWMNSVPMVAGDPMMEEWAQVIVCRYNGCCSDSSTCRTRRNKYRDNAIELYESYGGRSFWGEPSSGCPLVPVEGRVIDETDECYFRGGDPQYWRRSSDGQDGGSDWTMTTSSPRASNYGVWMLEFERDGIYAVEVYLDGITGHSKQAAYEITHGDDERTRIVVDQTSTSGWLRLAELEFKAGRRNRIWLSDNTGEASGTMTQLAFDAVQIVPIEVAPPPPGGDPPGQGDDDEGGTQTASGCSAAGRDGRTTGLFWLLAIAGLLRAKRRPRSPRR